eukprot:TRINITY_DN2834_c0_g1_i4.p1 TRINITY_DN2834_c0_g1~~TRINITY_DN2834_c0_g1_i4.p1  ORF type:complete len:151 (+),score=12.77 TRINITY_DN2834_c0_g1_i4:322-774(+)
MDFLSLSRSCGQTSSNCPNGFIGNNDLSPVVSRYLISDGCKLSEAHVERLLTFSLLELLTNARNNAELALESRNDLISNNNIRLSIKRSSFRVPQNDPLEPEVCNGFSGDLSRKGSISSKRGVLSSNLDSIGNVAGYKVQVNERGRHDNL